MYICKYIYIYIHIHLDPLFRVFKFWPPTGLFVIDPGRFTICNDLPMEGYDKESLLGRGACAAGSAQNVESRGPGRPRKSAAVESEQRSPKISARCLQFSKTSI